MQTLTHRPIWRWLFLLIVGGVGMAERTLRLGQWPSGFRPTLEFQSANAARTIFLALDPRDAPWHQTWLAAGVGQFLEAPVLQMLTAVTYLPDGIERPWTSVLFTVLFWFLGAILMYQAVRALTGPWGAALAVTYLLLAPFAVAISQSFQPEAVLFLGFAAVVWYALRHSVTDKSAFLGAAAVGALACLAKTGVLLPFVAAVFIF